MATAEETIREVKSHIDSVNWSIRKIQEATGDIKTAQLVTMEECCYWWPHPTSMAGVTRAEFRYDDENGAYWLDEYRRILENAYNYWKEGAQEYKNSRGRVEKLGGRLEVTLRGGELHLTEEFVNSREAYRVKELFQIYNFSELARKHFRDLLEYLEWKEEIYQRAEAERRRTAWSKQIMLFEEWEQIPE